jgi:hypothetical protein
LLHEPHAAMLIPERVDTLHQNNTYKAIRLFASSFNLYYSIWCNNEHELYNMDVRVLAMALQITSLTEG